MALAMQDVKALIDKLDKENALSLDEWEELIRGRCDQVAEYAAEIARQRSKEIFGNRIYTRGLIEISNTARIIAIIVASAGITGRLNVTA